MIIYKRGLKLLYRVVLFEGLFSGFLFDAFCLFFFRVFLAPGAELGGRIDTPGIVMGVIPNTIFPPFTLFWYYISITCRCEGDSPKQSPTSTGDCFDGKPTVSQWHHPSHTRSITFLTFSSYKRINSRLPWTMAHLFSMRATISGWMSNVDSLSCTNRKLSGKVLLPCW